MPLVKKDGQPEVARELYADLRRRMQAEYDEGGSIGKRYRRQDEIGTPWGVTVDHQTLEDRTVTLRDRDSLARSASRSTSCPSTSPRASRRRALELARPRRRRSRRPAPPTAGTRRAIIAQRRGR